MLERQPPLLSLVLPVHNQGDHIPAIVESYVDGLATLPLAYEIILVVNGSSDHSLEVCRALAAGLEEVSVIDLPERGWGRSVRAGLDVAKGDLLCFTNSARTTREILVLMLAYSLAYPDVVLKANRRIRESRRRRLGSLLYNIECRTLFDLSVWDINGTPEDLPAALRGAARAQPRRRPARLRVQRRLRLAQLPDDRGADPRDRDGTAAARRRGTPRRCACTSEPGACGAPAKRMR